MKTKNLSLVTTITAGLVFLFFLLFQTQKADPRNNELVFKEKSSDRTKQTAALHHYLRSKYEADMIRDPVTGKVPYRIQQQEIAFAKTIPLRRYTDPVSRTTIQNTYIPAGPDNIGGRTRALAYDVRYGTGGNQVIIAGSVSGGIYRTTNGGANWTRVSPDNEIHNVTAIAQDPRPGNQNTWYAGGGEPFGNTADEIGANYLGFGLYKSTDNGATWSRLPLNTITDIGGGILGPGVAERFDHPFDFVHKLVVNPVNGDLYIAGHRRIIRSSDGGATYRVVFGGSVGAISSAGQTDVIVSSTGKVLIGINGGNPDPALRGVWVSNTGNQGTFTRIAGGLTLNVDSVAGWRGNSYEVFSGSTTIIPKRIVMAMAPSNENIVYVCYENGLSNASPNFDKEADLFKLDMTGGTNVWTNRSANVPDFPGGNNPATDPFAIQGGYDLFITVKPTDENFVLLGGTSLYRSTDGFATTANTSWIGGYHSQSVTITNGVFLYPGSHADIHNLVFHPLNSDEALCANDGGVQRTANINTAGNNNVVWTMTSKYQTLQYYNIAIDPETGKNNFAGGSQDNGTYMRDKTGLVGTATADSNNHARISGGDGGYTGFSKISGSNQYLYTSSQLGTMRRVQLSSSPSSTTITPSGLTATPGGSGSEFGEFVTNFRVNPDNTEDIYYVNFNRLFRTTNGSTVTSSGWTELTGVSQAVNPTSPANGTNIAIRALAFTRGNYGSNHSLYIGTTNGRVFRLDNPRGASPAQAPVNITPPGLGSFNIQDIAVNPNDDNEIMIVISNYGATNGNNLDNIVNIWWTNNAKSASPDWRQAEGNLAGTINSGYISARSCVIVVKKDASNNPVTEYYVGTAAGLFGVENLGTTLLAGGTPTWQREGGSVLNFAVIQSLAYRPADNVLAVGTHGNGLFYTQLGTPNFNPPTPTGIDDPIVNDKNFISAVFPTFNTASLQYRIGNRFEIRKITVELFTMSGQKMIRLEAGYQNGTVDITNLARGAYILSITSDNRKYRHIQKIIR